MLTQVQKNAVFTNIGTAYTVDSNNYTATKTYAEHWSGEIDTPIIKLDYKFDAKLKEDTIGKQAEWDTARLTVDIFAKNDVTNGVHGLLISNEIARTLLLWFKQTASSALSANGLTVLETYEATNKSSNKEKIYITHFEVDLLYQLI